MRKDSQGTVVSCLTSAASLAFSAAMAFSLSALGQGSDSVVRLPEPGGQHDVSTSVWHVVGRSDRDQKLLEVVAQLWYPGEVNGAEPARYRPLASGFDQVEQYAFGNAPVADNVSSMPVILLCPGRGTNRAYYTSIAQDLVSHGFAVYAVDIPQIGSVEFPDGRVLQPSAEFETTFELMTGPYERVDQFYEAAVDIGLEHLGLAMQALADRNAGDPAGVLTGRLDLNRMGAFGHSLGGRVCGALVAENPSFRAFASMEGVAPRAVRRTGMAAATLMLYGTELPEGMALPNIREIYDHRRAEATILRLEGFGHNSVTDLPLLFPERENHSVEARRAIEVTRRILREFYTSHLGDGGFAPRTLGLLPEVTVIETSVDE